MKGFQHQGQRQARRRSCAREECAVRSSNSTSRCSLIWEGLERAENVQSPFTICFIESSGTRKHAVRTAIMFSPYMRNARQCKVEMHFVVHCLFSIKRSCKPPGGGAMETRGVPLNVCVCWRGGKRINNSYLPCKPPASLWNCPPHQNARYS